jgi:uncharacterized membrane protein
MIPVAIYMKLLHVLTAMWFISGIIGRGLTLWQAERETNIKTVVALVRLSGYFERLMVIPGSLVVLIFGLLTAWQQHWPLLGFLVDRNTNWLLFSILIYASMFPIIRFVFVPRGIIFGEILEAAIEKNEVTPELKAAFNDPVVRAAHIYELAGTVVIVILMVTKPF